MKKRILCTAPRSSVSSHKYLFYWKISGNIKVNIVVRAHAQWCQARQADRERGAWQRRGHSRSGQWQCVAHCALGGDRYTTHQHKCHAHILDTFIRCSDKLDYTFTSHLLWLWPSWPQQTDKMCGFKVSLVKWIVLVLRFCRSIDFPIIFRYTRVRQRHETCHKTDFGHRDLVS